jgi:hypothetical protein
MIMLTILGYTNIMQAGFCLLQINGCISFSECLPGFSSNGIKCERCPEGRYGDKCNWECNCDRNKRYY